MRIRDLKTGYVGASENLHTVKIYRSDRFVNPRRYAANRILQEIKRKKISE